MGRDSLRVGRWWLGFLGVLGVLGVFPRTGMGAECPKSEAGTAFQEAMGRALRVAGGLERATYILAQEEWRGEGPLPAQKMAVKDGGTTRVGGRPARCFSAHMVPGQEGPELYARRMELCFYTDNGLLARFASWNREGGALRRVELDVFTELVVNPDLTDADFDPDNPEYGF